MTGKLLRETAWVANRVRWPWALAIGVAGFLLFYFAVPAWILYEDPSKPPNRFKPLLDVLVRRNIHVAQWLGIAFLLLGAFFAIRNFYFGQRKLSQQGERNASWISRLLAKLLD